MDAPLDYGFVGRTPGQRPPDLSEEQVRDLCSYIEALAVVRSQQLTELGLDANRVAHLHSPDGLRGMARFLRNLYRAEQQVSDSR
jgi:hypothetical protein